MNASFRYRAQRLLFTTSAIGETGVGAAVLLFPELLSLLLNEPLEAYGLVVAQLLGGAVLALGVTWWTTRAASERPLARYVPGYIVFNLVIGLLFLIQAWEAARPVALPWIVAAVHMLAGVGALATLLLPPDRRDSSMSI